MKALGVDVGLRKGLDLVLLDEHRRVIDLAPKLPHDRFRDTVLRWAPDVVAIDSPPRWAKTIAGRETERLLFKLRISLYKTPTEELRRAFHDWMLAGMNAFSAIAEEYPLYGGSSFQGRALEVFPHATSVILTGGLMPAGNDKRKWRREILDQQGVDQSSLRTPDLVDAALAALTGLYALNGQACSLGQPDEGVIVLPCSLDALPASFQRLGLVPSRTQTTSPLRCQSCAAANPPNSKFCNQCGEKLALLA